MKKLLILSALALSIFQAQATDKVEPEQNISFDEPGQFRAVLRKAAATSLGDITVANIGDKRIVLQKRLLGQAEEPTSNDGVTLERTIEIPSKGSYKLVLRQNAGTSLGDILVGQVGNTRFVLQKKPTGLA